MLRVNAINRQELLKCLTFNPKSLVFKTVSVPRDILFHKSEQIVHSYLGLHDTAMGILPDTVSCNHN